jgi:membrane-associated phospholipid phosphatase
MLVMSGAPPRRPVLPRIAPWLRALPAGTLAWFAVATAAGIGFAILAAAMRAGALDRLDREVELAVHRLDARPLDLAMKAATRIGTNLVLLPAVAVVAALAIRLRQRAVAILLVIDTAVVIAAHGALQWMFARERPRLFDKIALPGSYSFPSGHAMSAVGIYGVIAAALIALCPQARRPVIAAAIAAIAAIGLSRIYLGVHWPSDVIGGFLAGVPPLVVSVHRMRRARRRPPSRPAAGGGAADRAAPRSARTPPGPRPG